MNEIELEAENWANKNKGLSCNSCGYGSPRISSEYPDCSTPFSFDLYSACSYSCIYCFSFFMKQNNPAIDKDNFQLKSVNVQWVIDLFEGKYPNNPHYKHFIKNKKVMHIGGMADNFCNFERFNKRGVPLIEYLLKTGYPIIISTKADFLTIPEYAEIFEKYKDTACCAIQSSIITNDDEIAKKVEIGVPSPTRRYENLRKLSELGYYTILRLRPFIIGVSDKTLDSLLNKMVDYKIHAISTEFYALDMRVDDDIKKYYKWLSDVCGFDVVEYYKQLSPPERGTYRRLNRKVKEQFIKKIYKFCKDNNKVFGCSDPDYKELNTTGSCCALPDENNPKFGLLNNWCRNQLTNQLIKLRKRYYQSQGKDKYLMIEHMKEDITEHQWKLDREYYNDSCCKISMPNSQFQAMNHWKEFIEKWNNLRSPSCPYNYFHGKIKPSGKFDVEGNIIYEYSPSEYENKWMREGIL